MVKIVCDFFLDPVTSYRNIIIMTSYGKTSGYTFPDDITGNVMVWRDGMMSRAVTDVTSFDVFGQEY